MPQAPQRPPLRLDSARVLYYVRSDSLERDEFCHFPDEKSNREYSVKNLAICIYGDDDQYYWFWCDKEWRVVSAYPFGKLKQIFKEAAEEFDVEEDAWSKY